MDGVLCIVARDRSALCAYLHQDFAAEEAEGVIQIFVDRRQPSRPPRVLSGDADGDPPERRRNWEVRRDLLELGCAFVREPAATSRP